MSLNRILAATRRLFLTVLREQAAMSVKTELFVATIPWRVES